MGTGQIVPGGPGPPDPPKISDTQKSPSIKEFGRVWQSRPKGGNAPANAVFTLCCYEIIDAFGGSAGVWDRAFLQSDSGKLLALLSLARLAGGLRRGLADGLVGARLATELEGFGAGTRQQVRRSANNAVHFKTF
jgi:hypothetical protein